MQFPFLPSNGLGWFRMTLVKSSFPLDGGRISRVTFRERVERIPGSVLILRCGEQRDARKSAVTEVRRWCCCPSTISLWITQCCRPHRWISADKRYLSLPWMHALHARAREETFAYPARLAGCRMILQRYHFFVYLE